MIVFWQASEWQVLPPAVTTVLSWNCIAQVMEAARDAVILDGTLRRVLEHFRIAKVDYAKNITRYTEIQRDVVQECIGELRDLGFIEKYTNTSIKRTTAKLKKSAEVHKHHTYFRITRSGSSILNGITPDSYLSFLAEECISRLLRRSLRDGTDEKCTKLVKMGLLDRNLEITDLGKDVLTAAREKNIIS